ncbi:MAG: hypothetical protein V4555_04235 [Acidobacteriota bacterium]
MKLRKEDQDWLVAEISRVARAENAALVNPHGAQRVMLWLKEWGAISAIWAVPLALFAMVITLGIFAINGITKNATFQATTEARLTTIEKTLLEVHRQQIAQDLTNHAYIPLEQFSQSLASLKTSIAIAREEKVSVAPNVMSDLQTKLIATDHNAPDYWPSAVQLVDFKYQSVTPPESTRNCLDTVSEDSPEDDRVVTQNGVYNFPQFSGPQTTAWTAHIFLGHCNLNLDDIGNFSTTSVGKFFQRVKEHHPQADRFYVVLQNAHVSYSGGKIIPVSGIVFENCTFDFTPPAKVPTNPFQSITTQLLAADQAKGTISIPLV